ncbi:hypothetical protein [Gardnerella vaginalis]|uniref:hypothetical protein n=1 Tax=Gardnerella vaginalis TaxID=2702 RepID=UPI0039F0A2E6
MSKEFDDKESLYSNEDSQNNQNEQNNLGNSPSKGDSSSIRTSFTDAELDAALASFEREFNNANSVNDAGNSGNSADDSADNSADNSADDSSDDSESSDSYGIYDDIPDTIDLSKMHRSKEAEEAARKFEEETSFEDTLEGLTGQKARSAIIITYCEGADLLSAFCKISQIPSICVMTGTAAVALLKNLDNDEPEAAVLRLSDLLGDMEMILIVNRANKLETSMYKYGEKRDAFLPSPVALTFLSEEVEDVVLGLKTMKDFHPSVESFDPEDITFDGALSICKKYFSKYGL